MKTKSIIVNKTWYIAKESHKNTPTAVTGEHQQVASVPFMDTAVCTSEHMYTVMEIWVDSKWPITLSPIYGYSYAQVNTQLWRFGWYRGGL